MSQILLPVLSFVVGFCFYSSMAAVLDFETLGGKPNDDSLATAIANRDLLNVTLNGLAPGDTFVIGNKRFVSMGGILVSELEDVTIQIDGTLEFSGEVSEWPRVESDRYPGGAVMECIEFRDCRGVTFTSGGVLSNRGTIYGNGNKWWYLPLIGYLIHAENRPRLLRMRRCNDTIVEKLLFLDSPYWTTYFSDVDGLTIRHSDISARRTNADGHPLTDLSAFNTDGFDFTGRNIHVHDCTAYLQDDCIAVKDNTQNVLVERVNVSGIGLTIGSIGNSTVQNVTFRDSIIHNSHKGIYMKFRRGVGRIEDITYENILIENPEQWAVWIGPAQQSDTRNICYANPCSICFPTLPSAVCKGSPTSQYKNIVLSNIEIRNPKGSPGVILADPDMPIEGLVYHNVTITKCKDTYTFEELFPQLPTDIYDEYVTHFPLMVAAGVVLFVLIPCAICTKKQLCCKFPKVFLGVLSIVVVAAAVIGGYLIDLEIKLSDTDEYYLCEGIENGTATGNTFPIPYCLKDKTTSSERDDSTCPDAVAIAVGSTAGALVAVTGAIWLVLNRYYPEQLEVLKGRARQLVPGEGYQVYRRVGLENPPDSVEMKTR